MVDPLNVASKRGARSRTYGHDFERLIVRMLKKRFAHYPWAEQLRRSDQTHHAHLPDVAGLPGIWPELQTGQSCTPEVKLEQAENDINCAWREGSEGVSAVVIYRRKRSRDVRVAMRISVLLKLLRINGIVPGALCMIEMSFTDFCEMYARSGMPDRGCVDTETS